MSLKIVTSIIILLVIGSMGTYITFSNQNSHIVEEIFCPTDSSPYVLTPIGSRSENFRWICLQCGHSWTKSYCEDAYEKWWNEFLDPAFVRDYTLLYLMNVRQLDISDPFISDWTNSRETPEGIVGYETYIYSADGIVVTIGYPVVLPKNTIYSIKIEVEGLTIWEGKLHRRYFTDLGQPPVNGFSLVYEHYGGVDLFDRGIHIIATSSDPQDFADQFEVVNDYWASLKKNETEKASAENFISIVVSRGDYPTGGYTLQVESFSWLESYPVQFRFHVNFTDPGEGVVVTEALTNPLLFMPIGKLDQGEYVVEIHITQYILTYDERGNPVYRVLQTLKEEVWKQTFIIE